MKIIVIRESIRASNCSKFNLSGKGHERQSSHKKGPERGNNCLKINLVRKGQKGQHFCKKTKTQILETMSQYIKT